MNEYMLVASDLDGTLVGSDMTISEKNKSAISQFKKMGVHFVPCTGRTLSEMQEIERNPDIRYIIYSNGAAIIDKALGESHFMGLSSEKAVMVIDCLLQYDCYIIAHYLGGTLIDKPMTDEAVERYNISFNVKELIRAFARVTESLRKASLEADGIESLTVFFKSIAETEECKKKLSEICGISFVDSWPCNVEIFRSDTSKGNALRALCKMLEIDISSTITIGDSGNDISMTRVAGLGLAVSNAAESLKAVADEIICSNDESAVKYVLEKYFK